MKELLVILLAKTDLPRMRAQVEMSLRDRGFEVFTEKPFKHLSSVHLPDGFATGGAAIIAFNPLMLGKQRRDKSTFPDLEIEKAAHLLAVSVGGAKETLRVATDTMQAEALARHLLTTHEIKELEDRILQSQRELETPEPVLADLSRFKYRAKVELIEWNGKPAVKKTFRPSALDAMERELAFFEDMSPISDVPAKIVSRTGNALIYEFIDNGLRSRRLFGFRLPIPLRLKAVRELAEFVHLVADRGWDPLDLTPGNNVLIEKNTGRLRAIDFEFAHHWDDPVPAHLAYFLAGVPAEATVARPLNNDMERDPYPSKWRPYTGLSKTSFLNDPIWLQASKRVFVHPVWLIVHALRSLLKRRRSTSGRDADLLQIALSK
ncbi:hypothetical protein [Shimia sediminis]|uniref:hypothetical protein n=1 Tax=Shimia sediminis TaxID=2497945 RepID=UPI000F8C86FC|nr:hypothetical protein [Shimia sediminis]